MWASMGFNLPGMVTPTLDVKELDKRISDLKAVEGWLKINLNMLHLSIQGMEMQRSTLSAIQAMGQSAGASSDDATAAPNPFASVALWPWNLMQQAAESAAAAASSMTPAQNGSTPEPAKGK
ncbi:MAG: PhaM family polyhydroxyalkanoate granule multifunctional regulatory protein [Rhodocyclaceae bacterium]